MKKIIATIICLTSVLLVDGQNMKELFRSLPDSTLMPSMTKINREDCIDFLESNMKAVVKNRFEQKSELVAITDDYLRLQLSQMSGVEMKLLPMADSTKVICWVETVGNDSTACESRVRFFTTDWSELPASRFIGEVKTDFLVRPDSMDEQRWNDVKEMVGVQFVKATLSKDADELSFAMTLGSLNSADRDKVSPYIAKPLVYIWKEGKFSL